MPLHGITVMKSTDEYFSRLTIKQPFASGEGTPVTVIGNDITDEESNVYDMNVLQGFAPRYANPISDNGRFVTRGDMNAIGNLASQTPFYFQAGGLNTFDQKFASVIGGYPKDAVLDFLVGTRLYKVVSLHDDNVVDFTGSDPQFENIEKGEVDDVNWSYANMDQPADTRFVAGKLPMSLSVNTANIVTVFKAPIAGYVVADGTFEYNPESSGTTYTFPWYGAGFWIKQVVDGVDVGVPTSASGYNGWTPFYALVDIRGSSGSSIPTTVFKVDAGSTYAVASTCGVVPEGEMPHLDWIPAVHDLDMKLYIV